MKAQRAQKAHFLRWPPILWRSKPMLFWACGGVSEGAVRRLVDVDHASRMDGVIAALAALGSGIIIEDQRRTIVAV